MSKTVFVEDIFLKFFNEISSQVVSDSQDLRVLDSFFMDISIGNLLTQNQAGYLLKILSKYKIKAEAAGFDFHDCLIYPLWRKEFRVIDLSKKIFAEVDASGTPWICIKFPYNLKEKFDKEIDQGKQFKSMWDNERKLRKLSLYRSNPIQLHEFAKNNDFVIEESFVNLLCDVEEIWQQQDTIVPYSVIDNGSVKLMNLTDGVKSYWEANATGQLKKDMFLAKSMGYPLKLNRKAEGVLENIVSSDKYSFWIKSFDDFLSLCNQLDETVAILIDRNTQDLISWLNNFVSAADSLGISRSTIKVCFRESKNEKSVLNQWIKNNQVGGKVEEGKILIFQHKPAKWLFKKSVDVKIIATNSFTPVSDPISVAWVNSHPCVCYLGDIKPTNSRNKQIVEL